MQLQITQPKLKMVMLRLSPEMYTQTQKLAKKYKTSQSKVCRALIEEGLKYGEE